VSYEPTAYSSRSLKLLLLFTIFLEQVGFSKKKNTASCGSIKSQWAKKPSIGYIQREGVWEIHTVYWPPLHTVIVKYISLIVLT
jgi:hypothetical protein